jgi:hypothetical protein
MLRTMLTRNIRPQRSAATIARMPASTPIRCLLVAATLTLAGPACAQNAITFYGGARAGSGFEQATTPSADADLRSSGALSVGIDWPYDASRQLQLLLSHQRTRLELAPTSPSGTPTELPLRVGYVHLGGLNYFEGQVNQGPYIAGGLGITHLSPRLQGTSSRVRPSMNVGIGYHVPIGRSLALRTELRGYVTLINSSGSFFCSGGCVVQIKGDTLTQVEGMVGVTLVF